MEFKLTTSSQNSLVTRTSLGLLENASMHKLLKLNKEKD
jgi:hypothetical protein